MAKFWMTKDTAGEWRWALLADNNRTIADSGEGYVRRDGCLDAITRVKKAAAGASVYDASDGTAKLVPDV
ncbi:YegP family protein [Longimicrobium sp.]|uniref:YegP family protein n=1 Tax=Longimicrobium sp. TaxID=2029185 RepID=UPI003B3A93C7